MRVPGWIILGVMSPTHNGGWSEAFLDHFEHPRNVGSIEHPDVSATVSNPVCGDSLDLQLKLEKGRIGKIRYRIFGCPAAIACASYLSVVVEGMTKKEAEEVDAETIERALGGLPQAKRHGAILAVDGLRKILMQIP